jgi:hypothetical protein
VVTALKYIAYEFSHREWKMPMRAPIFECNAAARFGAIKYNWLAEDYAAERSAADFRCRGGDIPVIPEKHGSLLCWPDAFEELVKVITKLAEARGNYFARIAAAANTS